MKKTPSRPTKTTKVTKAAVKPRPRGGAAVKSEIRAGMLTNLSKSNHQTAT